MATHKDLEFAVDDASGKERIFKSWPEACGFAVALSASGRKVNIDVLAGSEAAAKAWSGDEGVEQYREDPEASVFDRITVRAESIGRIA
jgi:hypothetical protein